LGDRETRHQAASAHHYTRQQGKEIKAELAPCSIKRVKSAAKIASDVARLLRTAVDYRAAI
jgi:hypothetical protein